MRRKLHVCYYMYARTALHCKRSDMSTAEYAYTVIQACMHHVCVCVHVCFACRLHRFLHTIYGKHVFAAAAYTRMHMHYVCMCVACVNKRCMLCKPQEISSTFRGSMVVAMRMPVCFACC